MTKIKNEPKVNIKPFTRQFYRGNGIYIFFALLQTVFITAANLFVSWLLQQIIDMVSGVDIGYSLTEVALFALGAIVLYVLGFAFAYISKPRFISKGIAQYKNYVFEELSKKNLSAFSGENSATYISALSNDATSIESGYLANIFIIIDQCVGCIGALALMFYYSPLLTLISIGFALVPMIVALITGNTVANAEKVVSEKNESYMSTLRDSLAGFSIIKSFRAEIRLCKIFAKNVRSVSDAKERRRKKAILVQLLSVTAGNILQLGVFIVGAYLALSGANISAGSVLIFIQLLNWVISPIEMIPQAVAECKASRALIRKLAIALIENVRKDGKEKLDTITDGIVLDNLSFEYEENKPILKNISFKFEAGKSYCIVGASGSGKSTLLHLLMLSHDSYQGSITYDKTNIRNLSSESLFDMVSLVEQNVFIFNATIRDNITMFSDFPREEVDRAIKLSGLTSLIDERGEDYVCGENGNGLSGGEKQRIAIARNLLKKSRAILVDEATAALDKQTAYQVSAAILDLADMTRIVVTHALDEALLKRYDSILALKNGTIIESGSFDSLMEKKDYFYSLYTISQ